MEETLEIGIEKNFETRFSNRVTRLSESGNSSRRSELAIMELSTPCVRLWELHSLAARTSKLSVISMGSGFRY